MNNAEEFEKITTAMNESPMFVSLESFQNFYLGCMTKYLAQIADALNEIKDTIKEKEDESNDR